MSVIINVTDAIGRVCNRQYNIDPPSFNCGTVPSDIGSVAWTINRSPNDPVNIAAAIAGGSGSFNMFLSSGFCFDVNASIRFDGRICNPTSSPKTITWVVPWNSLGNICAYSPPEFPALASFSLEVGGAFPGGGTAVSQSYDLVITGGPLTATLTNTIPAASVQAIRLYVNFRVSVDTVNSASLVTTDNFTVTIT